MSEATEQTIIELFTNKIEEIRMEFEQERRRRNRTMNTFLVGFAAVILTFVFSAGVIVQKVNSLEDKYYKVEEKVDLLYMSAIQKGDITFDTRGAKVNNKK